MLFVRHIQEQMTNIGLMVITMISRKPKPKNKKNKKRQKREVPAVKMAPGQQQAVMNLLKMVRVQTAVNQQQLAGIQVVHSMGR